MFITPFHLLRKVVSRISRSRFSYTPLITVTLSKSALLHNLAALRKLNPLVAPVLKSNAYGHGLIEIASILDNQNCPFLIVDSYFEAITLRRAGITSPLLVIGYTPIATMLENRLKKVAFTITSMSALAELLGKTSHRSAYIHLKIDTGMYRQGILPEEVTVAIDMMSKSQSGTNPHVILEGILTHFPDADNFDNKYTLAQIERWNTIVKNIKKDLAERKMPELRFVHAANSPGHAYVHLTAHSSDVSSHVSRAGLSLYGIHVGGPVDKMLDIKPVLEMKTIVSDVKKIQKGDEVGYGRSFVAPRDMTIATIPVGYFEGMDRRLSNTGKIVGRVSMNITTIDATEQKGLKRGNVFTVISAQPEDENSVESIAKTCGTIPYEILVHIPGHLKRVIID